MNAFESTWPETRPLSLFGIEWELVSVNLSVNLVYFFIQVLSTVDFRTTFEDVLVCDLVLMALLTLLFLSLSTEHVVFLCYVSLQFLD